MRMLREKIGLTQERFAQETGLTQSHLSNIETGARGLGLPTIRALLKRWPKEMRELGIEISDLIRRADG